MNTRELRIGNYVAVDGATAAVDAICSKKDGYIEIKTNGQNIREVTLTDIKPIPLTNELLNNCCEFDNNGRHVIGIDDHRHFLKIQNGYVVLMNRKFEDMIHFWDVQSLHQLQNLYFALKGEEMTVKL